MKGSNSNYIYKCVCCANSNINCVDSKRSTMMRTLFILSEQIQELYSRVKKLESEKMKVFRKKNELPNRVS